MPMYRQNDRIGCPLVPRGYSALKKAGILSRQWCLKCGYRCWVYRGDRFRYIETRPKLHTD
jgi:hypothetical protein